MRIIGGAIGGAILGTIVWAIGFVNVRAPTEEFVPHIPPTLEHLLFGVLTGTLAGAFTMWMTGGRHY